MGIACIPKRQLLSSVSFLYAFILCTNKYHATLSAFGISDHVQKKQIITE